MSFPTPQKPEALPGRWLSIRRRTEHKFESLDRAGDEGLRNIQAWAKERLTEIMIARHLGGDEKDEDFMDQVDDLYDTIRNGLTRQDLVLGFLINVNEEAAKDANDRLEGFSRELREITGEGTY